MDTKIRTLVKAVSYRTAVAISIFLASLALGYSAGFGMTFVVLSYTVGFASFYVQERVWNMFKWGKTGLKDKRIRSIAKTVTWRIFSFVILFAIGMLLGLKSNDALAWTVVTNILFVVVHYVHERMWNLSNWKQA
jgi:hypothetical protein